MTVLKYALGDYTVFTGLAADTKPTVESDGLKPGRDIFFETDTGIRYDWNGTSWLEVSTKGVQHVRSLVKDSDTVSTSDVTVISFNCLWVGGAGNIAVEHVEDDGGRIYYNVPAGSFLPVEGVRVLATGTTATNLVACRLGV